MFKSLNLNISKFKIETRDILITMIKIKWRKMKVLIVNLNWRSMTAMNNLIMIPLMSILKKR